MVLYNDLLELVNNRKYEVDHEMLSSCISILFEDLVKNPAYMNEIQKDRLLQDTVDVIYNVQEENKDDEDDALYERQLMDYYNLITEVIRLFAVRYRVHMPKYY